jgi:hypothetical protein
MEEDYNIFEAKGMDGLKDQKSSVTKLFFCMLLKIYNFAICFNSL